MIMHIPLLVIATFLQLTESGGNIPAAGTSPSAPPEQPWLLLAAVAMCAISFFFLHQAARFHVWVTAKDRAAPNSSFGIAFGYALSLLMVISSFLYLFVRYPPPEDRGDPGAVLAWYFLHHPSELGAGVLLASIVPSAIAIFTFAMAGFILRDTGQELPPLSRSPRAALVGVIFSSISLAGTIAGLIRFFAWIREP